MEAYLKSIGTNKSSTLIPKKFKLAIAGVLGVFGAQEILDLQYEKREQALKKERLAMPVYELSEEEMVNPPWVGNYDAWKYRQVKFKGRFIHKHSMMIHSKIHNYDGYEYYLPVVTKEDDRL